MAWVMNEAGDIVYHRMFKGDGDPAEGGEFLPDPSFGERLEPTESVVARLRRTQPRKRFEVFKRDGFRCHYCGQQPPEVTLVIDHIVPAAEGGKDDPDNLVTACEDCNSGKGAVPLNECRMPTDG